MSDQLDPLLQVLGSYKQAVFAKDIEAFVALYDDDIHVFDMWGAWSVRGMEAWRETALGWFSSLGTERVSVEFKENETVQIGELAVGHAMLTYTALSPEGNELRSLDNRITVALRRAGDSWKIFHEHTSAPIDHQTTKAILRYASGG
jgi:ketosteroid isomerase-like protein